MSKQFYAYSNSDISPISHEAKFRIKIFISSVPITAPVCLFAFWDGDALNHKLEIDEQRSLA